MSPQPMTASSGSSHDEGDSNPRSSREEGDSNPRSSREEGDANPRSSHDEGNANSRSSRANPRSSRDEGNSNSRSSHDKGDANSRSSHAKPRSSHDEGDANPRSSHTKGGKSDKEEYTALEKHVAFFDRNGDGIIYPWETYLGFRALGVGRLGSAIAGLFINMGLSKKTRPGKSFSPLFPIEVKNIRFGIHGSDTDAYDKDGRFVESKFEEIFKKHARKYRNALTYKEIKQLLKTNREPKDLEGWISAFAEWKILHQLYKDKNGLVTEEQIRGVYDGSLFKQVEKERLSSSRDKKSNK